MLTSSSLRGMLEDAWDSAPEAANTLRDELRQAEKYVRALVSVGSLSSVGKNSASQSYALAGRGHATALEIADGWRALIDLFDTIKAGFTSNSLATDDQSVFDEMLTRLLTGAGADYLHDFSLLRA